MNNSTKKSERKTKPQNTPMQLSTHAKPYQQSIVMTFDDEFLFQCSVLWALCVLMSYAFTSMNYTFWWYTKNCLLLFSFNKSVWSTNIYIYIGLLRQKHFFVMVKTIVWVIERTLWCSQYFIRIKKEDNACGKYTIIYLSFFIANENIQTVLTNDIHSFLCIYVKVNVDYTFWSIHNNFAILSFQKSKL